MTSDILDGLDLRYTVRDSEEPIELINLGPAALYGDRDKQATSRRQERKRREKLGKLRYDFEMKFSHSIQFNAVPDWSSHYISYSNLKKLYVASKNRTHLAID